MKLTTAQKTILIDTCNVMIGREATSDYSANLREVAKVALSALTAEAAQPVAWRHDDGPFAGMALTRSKSVADSWIANGWTVTPLYTALPAPTVPDELVEESGTWKTPDVVFGWNECRTATLSLNGGHDGQISD